MKPYSQSDDETTPAYLGRLGIVGAGVFGVYSIIKSIMSGMHDEGGLFGGIGTFFATIAAAGFAMISVPSISNWAKNTGVPWFGDKIDHAGQWLKKTTGIGQRASLDEALVAPEVAPQAVAAVMPNTAIKLSSVAYGGHLTDADMGQLSAQTIASQAEIASKHPTLSA